MSTIPVIITVACLLMLGLFLQIKWLTPLEKLAYWLVADIFLKLTMTLSWLNLNLFVMVPSPAGFYNTLISGLLIYSITICLAIGILWYRGIRILLKLCITIPLLIGLVGLDYGFIETGYVRLITWTLAHSFIRYALILALVFLFSFWFRSRLSKVGYPV